MEEGHGSHDTAREGVDPEDQTSGGTGGAQGTDTPADQLDQKETLGSEMDEEDVQRDRSGEPVTKPGASEDRPGQSSDAGDDEGRS